MPATLDEYRSDKGTALSQRMRALANNGAHPQALELLARARDLDEATRVHGHTPTESNMKKMVGAWARARRLWSNLTGESLI